ncbi:MAG: UDP-N-acetylmuramoyl-L-alanyl-D-glutamate--2,6-diaminopimelate ligase [Planctomycetota bacterium]
MQTRPLSTVLQPLGLTLPPDAADPPIQRLTDDSRDVGPSTLFIARGQAPAVPHYIRDALAAGCPAVLSELPPEQLQALLLERDENPLLLHAPVVDQRLAGRLAEAFHDHPAKRLTLLAVTGTNGKTTVAWLAQHLLTHLQHPAGLLGTIVTDAGQPTGPQAANLTTPGAIQLSDLLAEMVSNGLTHAVLETSSHALHQGRTDHLPFAAAAFTNLTGDHLDYHGSMEAYADAKAILFDQLANTSHAVLNADDPYHPRMARDCRAPLTLTFLDPQNATADYRADIHELTPAGTDVTFHTPHCSFRIHLPLVGRFNVSNALQALALVDRLHPMTAEQAQAALEAAPPVPGRLERIAPPNPNLRGPTVLVDYAHTHDALDNVAAALKPLTPAPGKLIILFGCGGDRDKTKRPKMADVACRYADRVVITSDNPRTEDPAAILKDIEQGLPGPSRFSGMATTIPDRAAAIDLAIRDAQPGDTVLIAGKGHEDYQILGTEKIHFDDREHAAAALATHFPV